MDIAETRDEKLTWDFVLPIITYSWFIFQHFNTDRVIDDMVDFARAWRPDLVIWDPMAFAGPIAARASGAAHVRMLWGMDLLARIRKIFLDFINHPLSELWVDPVGEWLGRALTRFGRNFDEEMIVGQWTIDQMPAWTRFPMLDVEYCVRDDEADRPQDSASAARAARALAMLSRPSATSRRAGAGPWPLASQASVAHTVASDTW